MGRQHEREKARWAKMFRHGNYGRPCLGIFIERGGEHVTRLDCGYAAEKRTNA